MDVFHVRDNAADCIHELVHGFSVNESGCDDGIVILV